MTLLDGPSGGPWADSTIMNSQSRANGSSGPQRRKSWLIEGGYTSETRHLEKLAEKQNQHRKLVGALEVRGVDVKPVVLTFGVGSTIYNQLWRTCASQESALRQSPKF